MSDDGCLFRTSYFEIIKQIPLKVSKIFLRQYSDRIQIVAFMSNFRHEVPKNLRNEMSKREKKYFYVSDYHRSFTCTRLLISSMTFWLLLLFFDFLDFFHVLLWLFDFFLDILTFFVEFSAFLWLFQNTYETKDTSLTKILCDFSWFPFIFKINRVRVEMSTKSADLLCEKMFQEYISA